MHVMIVGDRGAQVRVDDSLTDSRTTKVVDGKPQPGDAIGLSIADASGGNIQMACLNKIEARAVALILLDMSE